MRIRSRRVPYWVLLAAVAAFTLFRAVTLGEWFGWVVTALVLGLAIAHQGESLELTGPALRHRYAWVARDVDLRAVIDVWMTPRYRSLFPKLMLFDGRQATCLGPVERWVPRDWEDLSRGLEPWLAGRPDCRVSGDAARALRWHLPADDDG